MKAVEIERRLPWAGGLIAAGLGVEVAVSTWVHPLAFMTFALVACPLVAGGMLLFLWSLISTR
jgi:hypothetical protein